MLTIPTLPLDPSTLDAVRFCLHFQTKEGFYEVYEQKLREIWPTKRQKRGLKTVAYEQTEALYQEFFGHRCFADREHFFDKYSKRTRKLREV